MSLYIFIIFALLVLVFLVGHYGLPEKVDRTAFRGPIPPHKIMKGAEPFFWQGQTDSAFLLIHGFEDSPFTLRDLGQLLHAEGHTVIAPLLPGHGTSIADFKHTRYEHWYDCVQLLYEEYRPKYKKFFIVGFSMGGNLGLRLAIHYAHRMAVTGLILISAPIVLNGFLNGRFILRDWRLFFTGIVKELIDYLPKKKTNLASEFISPWIGYSEAYTIAPLHSLKLNLPRIKPYLKYIHSPICLIQASNDKTVSPENLHYILRKVSSREKRAFLFEIRENISTRHVLVTHQETRTRVFFYILRFIEDVLRDELALESLVQRKSYWQKLFSRGKTHEF
ncbi:MAG: alpha/beta fold hydrolase [Leptospiraceae bacterium]|nr:alpha/beta fold hydrolase [Leptospiraceae bacterium]MDW8305919.1 alpha/beta fold hydrolase [Leptospiraceae bacterium]